MRPCLEWLEDRTAPAVYDWVGQAATGPQFGNPANWLRDGNPTIVPPGPNDYCVINEGTPDPWVLEDITVGGLYMQDMVRISLRAPLHVISPQAGVLGNTRVSDIRFTNPIVPTGQTYLEIGNFPSTSPAVIGGETYEDDVEERWCGVQISSGYAVQGAGLRLHNVDFFIVGPDQPAGLVSAQFTIRRGAANVVVSNNDGNRTEIRAWHGGMIYFEPRQDAEDGGNLIQDQFNNSVNDLVADVGGRIDFGTFSGPVAVSDTVVELALKADSGGEFQFGKGSIVLLTGTQLHTIAAGGKMTLRNGAYIASMSSEGLAVHGTLDSIGVAGTTITDNFWYELGQGRVTVHNGGTVKFSGIGSRLNLSWLHLLAGSNMKIRLSNAQFDFSDTVHVTNKLNGTADCVWLEFTNEVLQAGQYNHLFFTWDLGCEFSLDPLLIFRQTDMIGEPYQEYGIGETSTEALFVSWLI